MVDFFQTVPPTVLETYFQVAPERVQKDLTHFGKTEALVLCSKLNLLTSDGGSKSPATGQVQAIRLLKADGILSKSWYNKLREHLLTLAKDFDTAYVVNRPALLEFMRWIATCCVEKSTDLNEDHVGKAFVRSLLSCSEFYGTRELEPTLSEVGTLEERRFQFLPGLRRAAVWAGAYIEPVPALGRAHLILVEHFFNKNPQYLTTFEDRFGITINEYMTCATAVVLSGFLTDVDKVKLKTLKDCFELEISTMFTNVPAMQPKWITYIDRLSHSAESLGTSFGGNQTVDPNRPFDFRPLRSKPILQFNGKIIVLDQRLFVESYCAGPLFVLTRVHSEAPLQDYGVACQNYAFELLERTNQRYPKANQAPILLNEPTGNTRPLNDIALGSSDGVVLIEAKGVWLNDDVLYQTDPDDFWTKILEKYGVSTNPKTGEEKRKGTAQLADVLRGLAKNTIAGTGDAESINRSKVFVPVLVMQDYLMTVDGLISHHLAIEFSKLMEQGDKLPATGCFEYANLTIHSLVPLTLHDLEVLESLKPDTPLVDLFYEYSKEVPNRGDSFSSFLLNRQTKPQWLPPEECLVKMKAAEVLRRVQTECFGVSPG